METTVPADFQVTEHFSFYEVTKTSQADLQDRNRIEAMNFRNYIKATCDMMERIRTGLGEPVGCHSLFRSEAVNAGTKASSKTSQHMMGQAMDFVTLSFKGSAEELDALFNRVLAILRSQKIPFGQLIKEEAARAYGTPRWIHLSLGAPYRDPAKCGQVLAMEEVGGLPSYRMIGLVDQNYDA